MKQFVVGKGGLIRIVNEDERYSDWTVLGEFIPIGAQRNIGKKDVKNVDIRDCDMVVHDGMKFTTIKYEEHKVPDGVIMGYFVPDGAEVLRKKK